MQQHGSQIICLQTINLPCLTIVLPGNSSNSGNSSYHSLPLPHGGVGWSTVFDCGISWSHLLTFYIVIKELLYFVLFYPAEASQQEQVHKGLPRLERLLPLEKVNFLAENKYMV